MTGDLAARQRRGPPAWRRRAKRALAAVFVLELLLQVSRPAALDDIRNRTFRVREADVDYITLQSQNFDPVTHRPILVYDRALFWRMLPNREGSFFATPKVVTNDLGLRERPLPPARPPGERRILFLGDSVTFGYGIRTRERFSDLVGAALHECTDGTHWRAVNAGAIGFTTFQGLVLLDQLWEQVEPDVVVFSFGVNDNLIRRNTDTDVHAAATSPYARARELIRLSQVLCAVDGLQAYARRELNTLRTGERHAAAAFSYYPSPPKRPGRVARVPIADFIANVAAAEEYCRERGAAFVVLEEHASHEVGEPDLHQPQYFERLASRFRQLEAWAQAAGVPFVRADAGLVLARRAGSIGRQPTLKSSAAHRLHHGRDRHPNHSRTRSNTRRRRPGPDSCWRSRRAQCSGAWPPPS